MADQAQRNDDPSPSNDAPRGSAAARLAARRAAKAAAKASKKGTAPIVPEGVAEGVSAASAFYEKHSRMLWAGVALSVVLGIGVLSIMAQLSKSAGEAAALLGAGVKTAQAMVVAEGETPPEDVTETYPTAEDRAQKALDNYRSVVSKFPDSKAATYARLGEAVASLELGKAAEAEKAFKSALAEGRKGDDFLLQWRALEGIGFALEAQDKHAEAVQRFEELAGLRGGALRPAGDYHRARMLVALGKKEEAATLLESMIKDERERAPEAGVRFESTVAAAEALLNALATELGKPKLEPSLKSQAMPPGPGGPAQGLSPELLEALRKQLEQKGATLPENLPTGSSNQDEGAK